MEMRLTSLYFLSSLLLLFLKVGVILAFFQSSEATPYHHEKNIIENGLAVPSATSHCTCGCIPTSLMD